MKIWKPFPKQEIALSFTHKEAFEILFGGARGPGKTDTGMVWLLGEEYEKGKLYIHHPRYRALVLRKNYEDLTDWLDRASHMYRRYGAVIVGKPAQIRFPSGAIFKCGHLRDKNSYEKYLGHEYQRELTEELTQIQEEKFFVQILGSCRSTIPELRPQVFSTTNPGGPGHMWVKKRYIDPSEPMKPFGFIKNDEGKDVKIRPRVFIPSTLDDNPILLKNDPGYVDYLESIKETDEELYKAWRLGSWDVFAGQVFKEFRRSLHVIRPVVPSRKFAHVLWIDWGYSENSAFAAHLTAIIPMKTGDGQNYNQLITYKEWYGNQKTPKEWARIIKSDCDKIGIKPQYGVTDPAMHNASQTSDISIASMMEKEWKESNNGDTWIKLKRGSNSGKNSRVNRVGMMHEWLSINPLSKIPYWVITENCTNWIRTVPMLIHDEHLVEAYDTSQEDHCADDSAYGLEKIKFTSVSPGNLLPGSSGVSYIDPNTALTKAQWFEEDEREVSWKSL